MLRCRGASVNPAHLPTILVISFYSENGCIKSDPKL
jgi:hypothetical protein